MAKIKSPYLPGQVTRAIHLELVSNITFERFLLALRRMVARRGMCSIIWSDNAKTFKRAKKYQQQCWRVLEADKTQYALSERKNSVEVYRGEIPMVGWVLRTSCEECQDTFKENLHQSNVGC